MSAFVPYESGWEMLLDLSGPVQFLRVFRLSPQKTTEDDPGVACANSHTLLHQFLKTIMENAPGDSLAIPLRILIRSSCKIDEQCS